ncbi:MAG: hypothetical protein JST46_15800 [Bacteroidetes bacterium]|nr:hypothetical protein [Bacteroidota bacterium]
MNMKIFILMLVLIPGLACSQKAADQYLSVAVDAERWISTQEISSNSGTRWRIAEGDTSAASNLYSGSAGVVLFYLELFHVTKNQQYLLKAKAGADYLASRLTYPMNGFDEVGLFTGEAGICFTLKKVYDLTHEEKYKKAWGRSFERLEAHAQRSRDAVSWRYSDVVYGGAGIGLMLLELGTPQSKKLAIQTGKGLIDQAQEVQGGKRWYMDSSMQKSGYYMPNFSHGTAGVSYFLTKLYQVTKDNQFLDAALAGASHLSAIQNRDGWVYHHDAEDGKDLYYLSWCHGPAGTARLYYALYETTKDKQWLERMKISAGALMKCGIPEKQMPGLWNNVGPCCGTAGVAAFFLELYQLFGDNSYLEFAQHLTENLIGRGTKEGNGIKWVQAEHRRRPELLQAQTGYMQGAAGIGMWLLQMYEFERKMTMVTKLP